MQKYAIRSHHQKNSVLITSYHLRYSTDEIVLFDPFHKKIATIEKQSFEDWLMEDTDELIIPIGYSDEFGYVSAGYSTSSFSEFWHEYSEERRILRLNEYYNLISSHKISA